MTTITANSAMFLISSPQVSGLTATGMVTGPQPVPAQWLGDVERRIRNSIVPTECAQENDGRWISLEVANSAIQFFRQASAVLPGEPFIYSSSAGDLVAEFKAVHGLMTSVVTAGKLMAVAIVDGQTEEVNVDLTTATEGELRRELKPIADYLRKGQHAGSARP
jgi:hypothetical protein